MAIETFSAVLLAGGRSTRMGRDKALLEVGGEPLWRRQRDVLAQAGAAEVYLSARVEQTWAERAEGFAAVLHDALPNCGPLAGITAALERSPRGHLAVIAIDLSAMTAEWFKRLRGECADGVGAVGRRGDLFEPLAAIYPRELMWLAWEAIARAEFALQPLLRAAEARGMMRAVDIGEGDAALFANWNQSGG